MLTIISGTFDEGNGIIIHDSESDDFYHKVVYKNCIEHKGNLYYKEDFQLFTCYETEQTMTKKDWFLYYLQSEEIDKTEYKDFSEWWHDMRKSGVIEVA